MKHLGEGARWVLSRINQDECRPSLIRTSKLKKKASTLQGRRDRFLVRKQLCPTADMLSLLKGTAGRRHRDAAVSASPDGLRGRVSARSVLKSAPHTLPLERKEKMFIHLQEERRERGSAVRSCESLGFHTCQARKAPAVAALNLLPLVSLNYVCNTRVWVFLHGLTPVLTVI